MQKKINRSLDRLRPRLRARFPEAASSGLLETFIERLDANFEALFPLLLHLYGQKYDFFYYLEEILVSAAQLWLDRPTALKQLDKAREADPLWYQSEKMLGAVCYVDLFARDLQGIQEQIPYFNELGLTYLHLMPLFKSPAENSDGGYAVSSYREVDPALGTMPQLMVLAEELRKNGISLVLDFVYNHTSDEHEWAQKALAGDPVFQDYFFIFPDRTMPDAYDAHLREIFPDQRAGSFSYRPEIDRWVWSTFNDFQWDLNYSNPEVFLRMMEEMLFLANAGVEVLRLDAVAFTWKELGTNCENLPEAHMLIQAMNALVRIAAPAMLFKSEAIVHPDDVVAYIAPEECQVSYNPLLMALGWEALATRDVRLLRYSMRDRFEINPECAWVNYVRSHDDIGWTFSDDDSWALGINGYNHRHFLNNFYTGQFPGSFARGLPFQFNPKTLDARISGTCASLAGLEKALIEETEKEVEIAIRRIILLYSIAFSMGGIPLIYLGDEIGSLNDYDYRYDPGKAGDSRWVHRPAADRSQYQKRADPETIPGRIYQEIQKLIKIRKATPVFAIGENQMFDLTNPHVLGYLRQVGDERMAVLANFTEAPQAISHNELRIQGLIGSVRDLVSGQDISLETDLKLAPYQFVWLV
jgi:glycosidase